ncbi:hypothetical protein CMESO_515 (nucleomorph) [Chroomonas mesostigmatica CCMP1168]|uniref:Uncharacterized protein n=1 Tax=Chroomonas mesostigmatica CCMP1168 TaxID=1195612 RepID=J7G3M1_9CRYP|nr:hypothetical protein CMESO_515 [Chroomonas mesostigmatica CCMP1168]
MPEFSFDYFFITESLIKVNYESIQKEKKSNVFLEKMFVFYFSTETCLLLIFFLINPIFFYFLPFYIFITITI